MLVISLVISLGPVPERSMSVNPGLKFWSVFVLHILIWLYAVLKVTFCVIITVSCSKGSTLFCDLELHVLRQENRA